MEQQNHIELLEQVKQLTFLVTSMHSAITDLKAENRELTNSVDELRKMVKPIHKALFTPPAKKENTLKNLDDKWSVEAIEARMKLKAVSRKRKA